MNVAGFLHIRAFPDAPNVRGRRSTPAGLPRPRIVLVGLVSAERVEGAGDLVAALFEDVEIFLGRAQMLVAQQFLNPPQIFAVLQQMGRKRVSQSKTTSSLVPFSHVAQGGGCDRSHVLRGPHR